MLSVFLLGACDNTASPPDNFGLKEGQRLPDSLLKLVSDGDTPGNPLHEKFVVLNLWATWCPPCRREMPSLERLSKVLDGNEFAVVGVSVDEDVLLASEFLLRNSITFPNFNDRGAVVTKELGLLAYPETLVIAPDRTLLRRMTGYHDWDSEDIVKMLTSFSKARKSMAKSGESGYEK